MFQPTVGYAGTFVGGNTLFLNPLQPAGTLAFDYQRPYASFRFDLYKGLSYKTAWNYYGYDEKGPIPSAATVPNVSVGLASIPLRDFNGSTATFSFLYSF